MNIKQLALAAFAKEAPQLTPSIEVLEDMDTPFYVFRITETSGDPPLYAGFKVRAVSPAGAGLSLFRRAIKFQAMHSARSLAYTRRTGLTSEPNEQGIIEARRLFEVSA